MLLDEQLENSLKLPRQSGGKKSDMEDTSNKPRGRSAKSLPIKVPRGKASLWPLFLFVVFSGLAVVLSVVMAAGGALDDATSGTMVQVFGLFLLSLLAFLFSLLKIFATLRNSRFEIRSRYIRYVEGMYALKQEIIEINYEDIGWVRVSQSLFERLLNVGTIELGAAHSHLPEVSVEGRAEPHKYAKIIHKRLVRTRHPIDSHQSRVVH